jgi:hypothetical protein
MTVCFPPTTDHCGSIGANVGFRPIADLEDLLVRESISPNLDRF